MDLREESATVSAYEQSVADYWNSERNPVNLRLGEVDGFYHHHYGVGDPDWSVLDGPEETRDQRTPAELPPLEPPRAPLLAAPLGDVGAEDRLLDCGSGRGGGSFVANARFGCH